MVKEHDKYLRQALELARQMTILADEGEAACDDDSCAVLYGVVRDCAYKIRLIARHELELHNGDQDSPAHESYSMAIQEERGDRS